MADPTPNYFTCTLGQAAALDIQQPHETINALIDALAEDSPDQLAVSFPHPGSKPEDEWTNLLFTYRDIKRASEHVASKLLHDNRKLGDGRQTIGLLCPSTPDFLFTWLALIRLGHAVLLIAPQCQPAAVASLCKTCEVTLLFYDDSYRDIAREAATASSTDSGEWIVEIAGLPFPDGQPSKPSFIPRDADDEAEVAKLPKVDSAESDVAYLHHTSGTSSGTPKPIPQTHRAGVGVLPAFKNGSKAATFTTTPLYHGGIADLFRAWTSRALIYLFPGKRVPITAFNINRCLDVAERASREHGVAGVKYFSSVPYVLQSIEADSRGLKRLQRMDIVGVGGAALPAEVGDRLVENRVNLISRFGSAECGFLLSSHRDYETDKDWQYLRPVSGSDQYLNFELQDTSSSDNERLAELVVQNRWPHMAKRNREDGVFATADMFARHPKIANAWRYHSRADSQLTLITGKKFDPAPLEGSLLAATYLLDDVLIFGNGQPYPGALLFRSEKAQGLDDADLLEQVWLVVEKLNAGSQDHARIGKAMLIPMAVLETPLEKSSKGTIIRGAAEKRFAQEIEDAYSRANDGDTANGQEVPDDKLADVIQQIVQDAVAKPGELTQKTELFAYGVDSLAGMRIRAKLRRLLPGDSKPLPVNVVEDCGTIERLTEYVQRRRHGKAEANGHAEPRDEHKFMKQLVEEYSHFIGRGQLQHNGAQTNGQAQGEVVLLTGATGALGAHVLDQYRRKEDVRKIYCLVRGASSRAADERVNKALTQRKLVGLSDGDGKVVVLQAALGQPDLGLEPEIYERLVREVTIVMHIAWSVNFRLHLRSFVKDNIASVTNLTNLALASPRQQPPRVAFCSSVASAMAYASSTEVPERIIDDPSAATNLGYSQSKWVAEQICSRAAATTRLKGRLSVYRVGQLAGDTVHGIWNEKEAWPMMLSAVSVTGAFPDLKGESLDWMPVDVAARAMIEGADAPPPEGEGVKVYHVLNDHKTPEWSEMLAWLEKREDSEIVSPAEWVRKLEAAEEHPAKQLMEHWRKSYVDDSDQSASESGEKAGGVSFVMQRTKEALPALRDVRPVDEAYFGKLWSWIKESV